MARLTPLWIQQGTFAAALDRRLIGQLWPSGGVNGMSATVQSGSMNLTLAAGSAAVPDGVVTGAGFLCTADAPETVAIPQAPPAGNDRIDVVCVQPRDTTAGGAADDWIFNVVSGAPAASNPSAPNIPAGQLAVCEVTVRGGQASVAVGDLRDRRLRGLAVQPEAFAPVRFRVAQSPQQTIPRIVWTTITSWGTPEENIGGGSLINGRYTIPVTGRYRLCAGIMWGISQAQATPNFSMQQQLTLNGDALIHGTLTHLPLSNVSTGVNLMMPLSLRRMQLNAGDTVGVQLFNGHGSQPVPTFPGYGFFEVERVG